ncbi:hypothetical protein Thpro_021841 [Acidihalobacter prosperus]|uniref:Uncharacterized protein n=1 Tax=Acidihalobacter prosperus TaxID=160660 RepID=A0A1A6C4M6_9GAMM|nr:hypothetical protein Thpro_021841 [Acidihalobacter prosperus]
MTLVSRDVWRGKADEKPWCAGRRARAAAPSPARRRPFLRTRLPRASYPDGYRIDELGSPPDAQGPRRRPPAAARRD